MSDNTQLNTNSTSGDIIATEDLGGGVKAQRVKIIVGAQHTDGGDVSVANPIPVGAVDQSGLVTRAANDDTVVLLRKLIDICETLATQDSSNRQKIVIDAITAGLTLAAITTVTTVSSCTNLSTVSAGSYDLKWNLMDQARNAYANGIRSKLT